MSESLLHVTIGALVAALFAVLVGFFLLVAQLPIGASVGHVIDALFAVGSVQTLWYVTRAAGVIAYLLVWLSTVWGLLVSSKIFDPVVERTFTYDLHEFLSLLGIGFIALHIVVLLGDRYLPFSIAQVVIPFIAPYRPVWVGVGIITFYLTLLVSVTFYLRRWIGIKTFRVIHLASFFAFFGAALHGLFSGTDTPLLTVQLMYGATTLSILFLTVYWILMAAFSKSQASTAAALPSDGLR